MKVGDIVALSANGRKIEYLSSVHNCIGRVTKVNNHWREDTIRNVDIKWFPKRNNYVSSRIPRGYLKQYATKKELQE
jgi:hypothetical protein